MDTSLKISVPIVLSVFICSFMLATVSLWNHTNTQYVTNATAFFQNQQLQVNTSIMNQAYPIIEVENQRIKQGKPFDYMKIVKAYDHVDGDLSSQIKVYGDVNIEQKGVYVLRYIVRNTLGLKSVKHIQVLVD